MPANSKDFGGHWNPKLPCEGSPVQAEFFSESHPEVCPIPHHCEYKQELAEGLRGGGGGGAGGGGDLEAGSEAIHLSLLACPLGKSEIPFYSKDLHGGKKDLISSVGTILKHHQATPSPRDPPLSCRHQRILRSAHSLASWLLTPVTPCPPSARRLLVRLLVCSL